MKKAVSVLGFAGYSGSGKTTLIERLIPLLEQEGIRTAVIKHDADGLLKDEEIYNIFDTDKILKRPASVAVGKNSGLAGIAYWVNQNYGLTGAMELNKQSPLVVKLKEWVDSQYEDGRTASLSNEELEGKISELSGGVLKCIH